MALSKYIHQPVSHGDIKRYIVEELRKIERSINTLVDAQPTMVVKPIDTARASTIVKTPDPHLFISLEPGYYFMRGFYMAHGFNGDLRFQLTFTGSWTATVNENIANLIANDDLTRSMSGTGHHIFFITARGILQFEWAQMTSHTDSTIIRAGSFFQVVKLL